MANTSITLKKTEETRLNQLFGTKTDKNGTMDIT